MGKEADYLEYPEVQAAHLIRYLFEVGPVMAGGMGPIPLSFGEIQSWQEVTGIELNNWEAGMIRSLSREYLGMSIDATNPMCPSPWPPQDADDAERAQEVAKRVRAALRG